MLSFFDMPLPFHKINFSYIRLNSIQTTAPNITCYRSSTTTDTYTTILKRQHIIINNGQKWRENAGSKILATIAALFTIKCLQQYDILHIIISS
jgi:hypothetical protein